MSDKPPEAPKKSPYGEVLESEIILGGVYRDLSFRVPDGDGFKLESRRVLIRQTPFNKMDVFANAWGNAPLEVSMYIEPHGKDHEKLTTESFKTALEEGRRINFTLLVNWQ